MDTRFFRNRRSRNNPPCPRLCVPARKNRGRPAAWRSRRGAPLGPSPDANRKPPQNGGSVSFTGPSVQCLKRTRMITYAHRDPGPARPVARAVESTTTSRGRPTPPPMNTSAMPADRRGVTAWILYDVAVHGYGLMIPSVAYAIYFTSYVAADERSRRPAVVAGRRVVAGHRRAAGAVDRRGRRQQRTAPDAAGRGDAGLRCRHRAALHRRPRRRRRRGRAVRACAGRRRPSASVSTTRSFRCWRPPATRRGCRGSRGAFPTSAASPASCCACPSRAAA